MNCVHLGNLVSRRAQTDVHHCMKFQCSVAMTDVKIVVPGGEMRVCPNSCACEGWAELVLPEPEVLQNPRSGYAYFTATNMTANIPMIEAMIYSARQAGVTEDFHAFTPGHVRGAINHPWDANRPWDHMQKVEILRDHMQPLDYEACIWLDSDTWFVRHPGDMLRHLRDKPIWVLLESEMTDTTRVWKEWWGAPFDELFKYFKTRGVDGDRLWNSNGGLFMVRRSAIQEFADRMFMIVDECRKVWKNTTDETGLALLGMAMVPDYAEYVNGIPDIVSCDWHGHYLHKIPDGEPWPHKNWMTQKTVRMINPPIVHAMRSKQAMQKFGQQLSTEIAEAADRSSGGDVLGSQGRLNDPTVREPEPLSLVQQAAGFASTSLSTVLGRLKGQPLLLPEDAIQARLDICNSCDKLTDNGKCSICGCKCNGRQEWFNALSHPSKLCPLGKW